MYLDEQYIKIMGSRLDRFRPLSRNRYECRCPLCGDSKKDKKKARGNFFIYKGSWLFKCHNCGRSMRVPTMLESTFPDLWEEYVMGTNREKMTRKASESTTQKTIIDTTLKTIIRDFDLPKLSDLPDDHPAVSLARDRKIPTKYLHDLYFAENFKKWSNTIVPDTFEKANFDDSRLVIPFRDKQGGIFAFQGRALKPSKIKYLTVKIDPTKQKIYGQDKVDPSKRVYVVEGPIDSMFLYNAVGTADSSLDSIAEVYPKVTFVWDNEPRSPQIVKKMERAIEDGHSVVVWKKSNEFNDINDAIMDFGFGIPGINKLLEIRTFDGLMAMVELNNWRKV